MCKIEKWEIESLLYENNQIIKLNTYTDRFGFGEFKLVSNIILNYSIQKEDIYIKITKLLDNTIDTYNFIAYETNVTSIPNIVSLPFLFIFKSEYDRNCIFKKNKEGPLLILCIISGLGTFSLGEIMKPMIYDDIHVEYNFVILPVINKEEFYVDGIGSFVGIARPKVLDFKSADTITIDFVFANTDKQNNIRLIPDLYDLECFNGDHLKRCIVSVDY